MLHKQVNHDDEFLKFARDLCIISVVSCVVAVVVFI